MSAQSVKRPPSALCERVSAIKNEGNAWYGRKRWTRAMECYDTVLHSVRSVDVPDHAVLCNLAMCLYQRAHFGDLSLGEYYCDEAIRCRGDYVKAWFWKMRLCEKRGDLKAAMTVANEALTIIPQNADIQRMHSRLEKKVQAQIKQQKAKSDDANDDNKEMSEDEEEEEAESVEFVGAQRYRYYQRYSGHCNLKTDIKEATFFGDAFICSGSDDGRCFVWERESGRLVNALSGVDDEVVNTVRRPPTLPVLAMSGIDSTIKLWHPMRGGSDEGEEEKKAEEAEQELQEMVRENQQSLSNPPAQQIDLSTLLFWANLMNQRREE